MSFIEYLFYNCVSLCVIYEVFFVVVYFDNRVFVDVVYFVLLYEGRDVYEIEYWVVRKFIGEVCIVYEKCEYVWDKFVCII